MLGRHSLWFGLACCRQKIATFAVLEGGFVGSCSGVVAFCDAMPEKVVISPQRALWSILMLHWRVGLLTALVLCSCISMFFVK